MYCVSHLIYVQYAVVDSSVRMCVRETHASAGLPDHLICSPRYASDQQLRFSHYVNTQQLRLSHYANAQQLWLSHYANAQQLRPSLYANAHPPSGKSNELVFRTLSQAQMTSTTPHMNIVKSFVIENPSKNVYEQIQPATNTTLFITQSRF